MPEINHIEIAVCERLLHEWSPASHLIRCDALVPDASLRRYYRLFYTDGLASSQEKSIVSVIYDSTRAPEAGGGQISIAADEAFVSLARFFSENGIAVPRVYAGDSESHIYLLEDLGSTPLFSIVGSDAGCPTSARDPEKIISGYSQAIAQMLRLQAIRANDHIFIFQRFFSEATLLTEMEETVDYLLPDRGCSVSFRDRVRQVLPDIAAAVARLPRALVHRDFHSWNLLIDGNEDVRVIDFQDSLIGPRAYDLASLLNDRDTDSALGDALVMQLVDAFKKESGFGSEVLLEYALVLLQRDLKVAGRFAKLATLRGLDAYRKWIPGTLRRIGRSLAFLSANSSMGFLNGEFLALLSGEIEEVEAGAHSPLF